MLQPEQIGTSAACLIDAGTTRDVGTLVASRQNARPSRRLRRLNTGETYLLENITHTHKHTHIYTHVY